MSHPYCDPLGIEVPDLERVKDHREAKPYSLLIVALLESGAPRTLVEVAHRFAEAGVAPVEDALRSLRRCKPARLPVVRDGDLYGLDPHHPELALWTFRLGLRPPRTVAPPKPSAQSPPLPGPDAPLTRAELDEVLRADLPPHWTPLRLAAAILDAHGGALFPEQVRAFAAERASRHPLHEGCADSWHRAMMVRARADGRWELDVENPGLRSARLALRDRLADLRRRAAERPDPAAIAAEHVDWQERRRARSRELARLRRVLVHAFPVPRSTVARSALEPPRAVVLLDVAARRLTTHLDPDPAAVGAELARYEAISGVDVRAELRALGFDPGARRLLDVGLPQKTYRLNRQGRTLKLTLELLIRSTCNISRPLGDPKTLREYLRTGQSTRLRRRLEADAKALFAWQEYGRLHGSVRLRWGFLDEKLAAPWADQDEERLHDLLERAHERGELLEIVRGTAPGWTDPWSRARLCHVTRATAWGYEVVDEDGLLVERHEIQAARLRARSEGEGAEDRGQGERRRASMEPPW